MRTATSAACWARRFFPENASTSARSCPIRAVPASPELVATVRRLFRRPIALRPPRSITVTMEAGDGGGVARRAGRSARSGSPRVGQSTGRRLSPAPALNLRGGWLCQRAGGPRRRYCAAILLHCASASCLSEAIGIFAAAVRQACFAVLSAVFTFALLVVI